MKVTLATLLAVAVLASCSATGASLAHASLEGVRAELDAQERADGELSDDLALTRDLVESAQGTLSDLRTRIESQDEPVSKEEGVLYGLGGLLSMAFALNAHRNRTRRTDRTVNNEDAVTAAMDKLRAMAQPPPTPPPAQ